MFAVQQEDVVNFIKPRGPVVPNDLRKHFGVDLVILGAVLSELCSRGILKITSMKKGSSPFYYLPGQEIHLEKLTGFLHEKDRETADWLRTVKVAEDTTLDALKRVSLRKLSDFAKPLKARVADGSEILFWRYYLVGEEEAINMLKNTGKGQQPEEVIPEEIKPEPEPEPVPEPEVPEEVIEEPKQTKLVEVPEEKSPKEESIIEQQTTDLKLKESLAKKVAKPKTKSVVPDFEITPFYEDVKLYLDERDIIIVKQDEIAKKKEYEFLLKVPSAIGDLIVLARAKSKKKLNESDVAPALLAAKMMDVSCLFLTNGTFTKKALKDIEMLYTGLIVKKI